MAWCTTGAGSAGQRAGQADAGGGGQAYGQPRRADLSVVLGDGRLAVPAVVKAAEPGPVRAGCVAYGLEGVLGERASLHDDRAVVFRVRLTRSTTVACGSMLETRAAVGPHAGQPVAYLGLGGGQDHLGVVRVVAGEVREPGFFVAGLLLAAKGADGPPVVSGCLAQLLQSLPVGRVVAVVPEGPRDGC